MTKKKKRAIALAGGGPAAGLHIGALAALEAADIKFHVFALSCVGAWVGLVYNTRPGEDRAAQTYDFFHTYCFRDDRTFEWFPINRGFATDVGTLWQAWERFHRAPPGDWRNLILPEEIYSSFLRSMELLSKPGGMTPREFNYWILNDVLAVHPFARYLTSLVYKSEINGLSKVYYKDSKALDIIFKDGLPLKGKAMPHIYHNAWRMPKGNELGKIQIFHNKRESLASRGKEYMDISAQSLCACSALPYIEESIVIGAYEYTEGALVDTVNFKNLLRDYPDLDEVWVNRIVDDSQVKSPRSLAGSLANLPMQFAAEVGEDDIKLFRQHVLNQSKMRPRVVEIPIRTNTGVDFEWNHSNLTRGRREGYAAVRRLLESDPQLAEQTIDD